MTVRAERTRYAVPGWGVGELWTDGERVLAHDFRFEGSDPTCVTPHADRARSPFPADLVSRLLAFLHGENVAFADVRLDLEWATPFQRAVAGVLREIDRGEIVSYGELAALAGYPGAARAVGTFCARNRFMFLLPCHRVVGAGGIGGYGSAGTRVKRRLLGLEGVRL